MDFLESWTYDRPALSLVLGPRGGGKSYLAGLATHLDSIRHDDHDTKVLGGSEAQSMQIYEALKDFATLADYQPITDFTATRAAYCTGSTVSYIPASSKSVRGPHVASLKLDEVDEMDPDIRESAFGMCMDLGGVSPSIAMTSTWHKIGGPMADLLERGDDGEYPVYRYCVWEVLERCPDSRSGKHLENCPGCPLVKWCHDGSPVPKAKRSAGHYTIDSLIQKVRGVSPRVFESDYLCLGPKADGAWFTQFSEADNVTEAAEYDPSLPVHIGIDCGVWTGCVFLQAAPVDGGHDVRIFAEYLSEGSPADECARSLLALLELRCGGARRRVSMDSAGGARNPVGAPVVAEYERNGLRGERGIEFWPKYPGCVQAGLATVEALVRSADGTVNLRIHSRCRHLIDAFRSYCRARRAGQLMDWPEDPQHPHEDLIDPVRGVLSLLFPEGRKIEPPYRRLKAGAIF